ncbi:restriction endonuclease subunit S [Prevotella corporis]|uniref:restriction endonuclease subunit S n=1 Tax=Prevotella corporis TaxID=28128 RepID=UPI0018D22F51|nr:restriction endonuclease subunit S [Prevotella corporis]
MEWKTLGEVCIQISGMRGVSNKWADNGNCRFIDYLNAYKNIKIDINALPYATVKKLDQTELQQGDILFTSASETPDECAISSVIEGKIGNGIFLDDHLFGIRIREVYKDAIDSVFLNYYFHSPDFRKVVNKTVRGVTRFYISKVAFMKLSIPLPPLSVQHRIVEILDKFTALEAELEAELDCRKRQYEYYRNQLLSFDMLNRGGQKLNDVKIVKLKDVCTLTRGKRLTKRDLDINGIYPVYHGGIEPIGYYNQSNRKANSTMIINVGASAGTVGYSANDFWSSDGCFCFSHNEQLNQRYLYYSLQNIETFIKSKVRKAGIPTLDNKVLEKILIPLPPLSVQREIVEILDKFDTLTNSISEGLPKEIELRRKQYEYYRNQLLSFSTVKEKYHG